jgi:hypothetical protein
MTPGAELIDLVTAACVGAEQCQLANASGDTTPAETGDQEGM